MACPNRPCSLLLTHTSVMFVHDSVPLPLFLLTCHLLTLLWVTLSSLCSLFFATLSLFFTLFSLFFHTFPPSPHRSRATPPPTPTSTSSFPRSWALTWWTTSLSRSGGQPSTARHLAVRSVRLLIHRVCCTARRVPPYLRFV